MPAISRRIFSFFPTWRYVQTPSDRRLNRALAKVRTWLDGLLAEARARLRTEPARPQKPSNLIEAMLTAIDEKGKPFSDDVIMSNLLTMLLAGEDTTAFTFAWAVHQLCDSPQWAAEVRSEADEVIGVATSPRIPIPPTGSPRGRGRQRNDASAPCRADQLADANVDTTLGDISFRKGRSSLPFMRPAALDPANFVDPLAFRPERWLEPFRPAAQCLGLLPFRLRSAHVPGPFACASRDEDRAVDALQELRRRACRRAQRGLGTVRLHDVARRAEGAPTLPTSKLPADPSSPDGFVPFRRRLGRACTCGRPRRPDAVAARRRPGRPGGKRRIGHVADSTERRFQCDATLPIQPARWARRPFTT